MPVGLHLKEDHIQAVKDWPYLLIQRRLSDSSVWLITIGSFSRIMLVQWHLFMVSQGSMLSVGNRKHQQAFNEVKDLMTSAPVLTLPNSTDPFILDTDASAIAIGAELLQLRDGQERVIAYGSLSLSPEQRRYCVTRRELLAIVRFTRQYRHYLLGKPFTVRTDHGSLTWAGQF